MSRITGFEAEKRVVEYLQAKGYEIIATNYTTPLGEIDIIVEKEKAIIFVEVKMRTSSQFGFGREYVTRKKLQKMLRAIDIYRKEKKILERQYQVDVVELQGDIFTHIENITL